MQRAKASWKRQEWGVRNDFHNNRNETMLRSAKSVPQALKRGHISTESWHAQNSSPSPSLIELEGCCAAHMARLNQLLKNSCHARQLPSAAEAVIENGLLSQR
ncbi:MAG TPA: hypothetical protein VIH78_17595 [Terriglobales bacterium]